MLGQIANYCPVISRNTLIKNSTSIQSVWNMIREHFGFQITGAHFLDFANLHLEADERPEDLFQRLMAFVEDTLLHTNSLSHHGDLTTEDEELTATSYCPVETHRRDRPDQRILPDSTFTRLYEILWRCYTIPGCACVCAVRHGHARLRNGPRRAHEPSTW